MFNWSESQVRYVYAHFPINVNVDKQEETGLYHVEIRYVIQCAGRSLDIGRYSRVCADVSADGLT